MKYLVDANVLSEPTKPSPDPRVIEWLRANEPDIAVDPMILGELRFGILILPKGKKRTALERWFSAGVARFYCLSWDADTGLKWAELLARLRAHGKAMPIKDSLIAATAIVHDLAVATRNRNDLMISGMPVFESLILSPVDSVSRGQSSRSIRSLNSCLPRNRGFQPFLRQSAVTLVPKSYITLQETRIEKLALRVSVFVYQPERSLRSVR